MICKMNLKDSPFNSIKNGSKTIELRLYDEKRKNIKKDDIIEFNNDNTKEIIRAKVKNLYIFKSFVDLYNVMDKKAMGYGQNEEALPEDMEKYYNKDDIDKYGVVGIEIELL